MGQAGELFLARRKKRVGTLWFKRKVGGERILNLVDYKTLLAYNSLTGFCYVSYSMYLSSGIQNSRQSKMS
jgi:hypothetical protein